MTLEELKSITECNDWNIGALGKVFSVIYHFDDDYRAYAVYNNVSKLFYVNYNVTLSPLKQVSLEETKAFIKKYKKLQIFS